MNTSPRRVLVVDDDRAVRYLVRSILLRAGYDVAEAPDAAHATQWLDADDGTLDLLITDVVMPGATGPELFQQARVGRPNLQVLYMSGYGDETVRQNHAIGRSEMFIQKPFSTDGLAHTVARLLRD